MIQCDRLSLHYTKRYPAKYNTEQEVANENKICPVRQRTTTLDLYSLWYLQPATKIVIPFFSRKYVVINSANLCHICVLETWLRSIRFTSNFTAVRIAVYFFLADGDLQQRE